MIGKMIEIICEEALDVYFKIPSKCGVSKEEREH